MTPSEIILALLSLVVGVVSFLGKGVYEDVRKNSTAIAVLQSSQLQERVAEHERKLETLNNAIQSLSRDMAVVVGWVDEQRHLFPRPSRG